MSDNLFEALGNQTPEQISAERQAEVKAALDFLVGLVQAFGLDQVTVGMPASVEQVTRHDNNAVDINAYRLVKEFQPGVAPANVATQRFITNSEQVFGVDSEDDKLEQARKAVSQATEGSASNMVVDTSFIGWGEATTERRVA